MVKTNTGQQEWVKMEKVTKIMLTKINDRAVNNNSGSWLQYSGVLFDKKCT